MQIDGIQMFSKNEKQPVFVSIFVKVSLVAGLMALYKWSSYVMTVLITNFGSDNQRLGNLDYDVVILKNYKAIPLSLSVLKEAMNSWVSHFTIMGAPQKKIKIWSA